MLKDEGRFYPGYSIVIYDMIIKCGNKVESNSGRITSDLLVGWKGGRTVSYLPRPREEWWTKTLLASFFKSYMHNSQGINYQFKSSYQCKSVVFHSLTYLHPRCEILSR